MPRRSTAISLGAEEGELVAIVGANGAGKSSLIRAIAGIETPRAGPHHLPRPGHHRPAQLSHLQSGHRPGGRGAADFPLAGPWRRTCRWGALLPRGAPRRYACDHGARCSPCFPRLEERRGQAGRHNVGRRAADAGDRSLPDGESRSSSCSTNPRWGLAPALVQELFRTIRALNQSGLTVLLVEQKRRRVPETRKPRLRARETAAIVMAGTGTELLADDRVRQAYLAIDAGPNM